MSVAIKICGLSTPETVDAAIEAGATHIGLVHFEPSPRHVPLDLARELREQARGKAKVVLLMVNADPERPNGSGASAAACPMKCGRPSASRMRAR